MRESERRIKEYQERLPHIKAKVMSVAFFFAVSVAMMVSATFAWLTVSGNPEVTGIETTIAANGNLEIALSDTDGLEPDESMVGDAQKELRLRNTTWGNLVNLSDESYGLDKIILRPAALNVSSLLESPLYAAVYGDDGRVETLSSEFAYSNYNSGTKEFMVPNVTQYGVRAISSVTYKVAGADQFYHEALTEVNKQLTTAQNKYLTLTSDNTIMSTISEVMGIYLTDGLNNTNSDYQEYIPQLYAVMEQFDETMDATGDAILQIAYLQGWIAGKLPYEEINGVRIYKAVYSDIDTLLNDTNLSANGISIEGLSTYKSDRTLCKKYLQELYNLKVGVETNATPVYWDQLINIVNYLVDINTTEVDGYKVPQIGASEAASMLFSGSDHNAVIKKGALFNMEKILGVKMYAKDLPVTVTYKITLTIDANIYTDVAAPYYLPTTIETTKNRYETEGSYQKPDAVAADTYGMAIDLWVRSNSENDYLLLEGTTITKQEQKKDSQGGLYFTDSETNTIVIQRTDSEKNITYYNENGDDVTDAIDESKLSIVWETIVIGYEGENRVWDDSVLTEYSTTQGSGSCYTFYTNSPQDQAQSLELLKAMTVVFIDDKGELLAYADMDTDSYHAENGRVIVPLKLRTTSMQIGTDEEGNPIYAITGLERGVAKRITAIIYVDGTKLTNSEVLADGNIQGQLNIQFGSAATLEAIVDQEIFDEEIHISGSVTPTTFEVTEENKDNLVSTVTLNITGSEPKKVTANFVRAINSTQGTRQETMTFQKQEDGSWMATMKFTAAGTYILRTVWLDGIEYYIDNHTESPLTVTIPGFSISNISWTPNANYAKILSAESAYSDTINLQFSGGGIEPKSVQGFFENNDNQQITVNFRKGAADWSGTAQFTVSGTYKLQYLLIDGEYYEIPLNLQKTLDVSLGMKAQVTIPNAQYKYDGTTKKLDVYVTILDNGGNKLTALENVSLQYKSRSSSLVQNGLYTELTWNATEGRYEGFFNVSKVGTYEFAYLTIGSSSITSAERAGLVQAISPDPPTYYSNETEESQFAFETDVDFRVGINNAPGDYMIAILEKDGQQFEIQGSQTAHLGETQENEIVSDWVFDIPTDEELADYAEKNGTTLITQEGTWSLVGLKAVGAYDKSGKYYDAENPMIVAVPTGENTIKTTISADMTVVVSGTSQTVTSQFLSGATINSGLKVQIVGSNGEAATGINYDKTTGVAPTITFKINTGSVKLASSGGVGYDKVDNLITNGTITVPLVPEDPDNPTTWVIDQYDSAKYLKLVLEGTYEFSSFSYGIGNKSYTVTGASTEDVTLDKTNAPVFTLNWTAPVVKITGLTPEAGKSFSTNNKSYSGGATKTNLNGQVAENRIYGNGFSCDVYMEATISTSSMWWQTWYYVSEYETSQVTATLSNITIFDSAIVSVTGNSENFSYPSDSERYSSTIHVGSVYTGGYSLEAFASYYDKTVLGTVTSKYIVVTGTYNNITYTYTFELANPITINNPY